MKHSTDVLIVGGGIIGCAIAYFLRKKGIDVMVLDKGDIGGQTSSAAAGLLAPIQPLGEVDAFKKFQIAGVERLTTLIPELEEVSGVRTDYERTGTLRILSQDNLVPYQTWAEEWQRKGFQIEVLTAEETYQREPLLLSSISGAIHIADEAQVAPVQLVKAFWQGALNLGANIHDHVEVSGIQTSSDGKRITGICTADGEVVCCEHLILAVGVWTAQCGMWLNASLAVHPVRGEIVALQQPSSPIRHIIFDGDIYIAPKPNGTVIIGGTKAEVGFDTSVSAGGTLQLLQVATKLVPELATCSVQRMWAGLRPKTPTSHPLLGPIPSWENATVASGHGGFGVMLSAITGESIATLIETGTTPQAISPFAPQE